MSSSAASLPAPPIVRFYGEGARDINGRTLVDILNYDDRTLERKHNYIQVLFPLPEGSPFNSQAPIITRDTREAFLENPSLRDGLFKACERLATFYGFDIVIAENDYTFAPKPNFLHLASDTWLSGFGHNHLRITRIIRCLRILGHERLALAFYDALIREDAESIVDKSSLIFWERAAKRPLYLPPDESNVNVAGLLWLRDTV